MNYLFKIGLKAIITFTLLLQFYLIGLVIWKRSTKMDSFRFALFILLQNEIFFSLNIGLLIDPDFLAPYAKGAIVDGIFRYLGPNGGRIAFMIGIFFGAGVFTNQIYCLAFRYTAIQQRFSDLHRKFNKWKCRLICTAANYLFAIFCAILAYNSVASPEEAKIILQNSIPKNIPNIVQNDSVVILLNEGIGMKVFGIFLIFSFTILTALSISISILIHQKIVANANSFSERTYRLHQQLTRLLIVQFSLPILFLILPVSLAIASVAFHFDLSKFIADFGMFLRGIYPLAKSLSTLWFIIPFRNYTLQLIGLKETRNLPAGNLNQIVAHNLHVTSSNLFRHS